MRRLRRILPKILETVEVLMGSLAISWFLLGLTMFLLWRGG